MLEGYTQACIEYSLPCIRPWCRSRPESPRRAALGPSSPGGKDRPRSGGSVAK